MPNDQLKNNTLLRLINNLYWVNLFILFGTNKFKNNTANIIASLSSAHTKWPEILKTNHRNTSEKVIYT